MNVEKIRKLPLHVILFSVFYVWNITNKYYGFLSVGVPFYFFCIYLLLSLVIFVLGWFLLKSMGKSGLWTFIVLILFFFFGKMHDFLRGSSVLGFLAHYKILLPVLAAALVVLTIAIRRSTGQFRKANLYLTYLFVLLIAMEGIFSLWHFFSDTPEKNILFHENVIKDGVKEKEIREKPDIFFIVFDEYASSLSLKKYLGFDNSPLDSSLHAHGFYTATNAKSNYNYTLLSLASTFSIQYLAITAGDSIATPSLQFKGKYSIYRNFLAPLFGKMGYQVRNFGLVDFKDYPAPAISEFQEYYMISFYKETLWNRIQHDILWNFTVRFPEWAGKQQLKRQKREFGKYQHNFSRMMAELKTQDTIPKFIYGHILMPHAPYYLNRHGAFMNTILDYSRYSRDSLYLEQLRFCNRWIDSIAKAADQPFGRPRVVIVEGDHGYRDADDRKQIKDRAVMNLSAYYFSDGDYTLLYDSISPVNSFRVVLNKYFDAGLPLLKDSSAVLR